MAKRKVTKRTKRGKATKGFPKLSDLEKTIPKGGLMSPSLRKGLGKLPSMDLRPGDNPVEGDQENEETNY